VLHGHAPHDRWHEAYLARDHPHGDTPRKCRGAAVGPPSSPDKDDVEVVRSEQLSLDGVTAGGATWADSPAVTWHCIGTGLSSPGDVTLHSKKFKG